MELVALQPNGSDLFVGCLDALWVLAWIEFGTHPQPGFGRSRRYQMDDHLMADQRLAAPVLTDESE